MRFILLFSCSTLFTACACLLGGGDYQVDCVSQDNSLLRIDSLEQTFRLYSDSVFFTESADSLRIYYAEQRFGTVVVDLRLRGAASGSFTLDTSQSMVILRAFSTAPEDTFRLENASVLMEAYQPGTCCSELWCPQNVPDQLQATVLGILRSRNETRVMHFKIDVVTQREAGTEC